MPLRDLTPEEVETVKSEGHDPSGMKVNTDLVEQQPSDEQSIPQAILARLKAGAGGIAGGGAGAMGGAELGAMAGAPLGPIGVGAGGVIGGIAGAMGGGAAGQGVQRAIINKAVQEQLEQEAEQARQQHPIVSAATDITAGALASGGMFSPTTPLKALAGNRDALRNVIMQAGVVPAAGAGAQLVTTGTLPSLGELGQQALGGALFAKASPLGEWAGNLKSTKEPLPDPLANQKEGETTGEQQSAPSSPYMMQGPDGYSISDKNIQAQFTKKYPKVEVPEDAANDPNYWLAKTTRDNLMKLSPDEMRQRLHDEYLAKLGSAEPSPEPLKMAKEGDAGVVTTTPQDTTTTTGEVQKTVEPKVEQQGQEDAAKVVTEDGLPHGDGQGPNKATETPTGQTQQTAKPLNENAMRILNPNTLLQSDVSRPPEHKGYGDEHLLEQEESNPNGDNRTDAEREQDRLEGANAKYSESRLDPKDLARFQELNALRQKMQDDGTYATPNGELHPDYLAAWKEAEGIKNKYGGQTPGTGVKSEGAGSPNSPHYATEATPIAIRDHINTNKATTGSVIKMFAEAVGHPFQPLAKWIHQNMDSQSRNVPWSTDVTKDRSSYVLPHKGEGVNDEVIMHPLDVEHAPTVMEEALHSMTGAKLPREWEGLRGAELKAAMDKFVVANPKHPISELVRAYQQTAKALGHFDTLFNSPVQIGDRLSHGTAGDPDLSKGKLSQHGYAMGDFYEFIAHAFKNKALQETLNKIPAGDGTTRSMWQRVVDAVSHLLGVPVGQKTMLDRVLRSSAELIQRERGEAGSWGGKVNSELVTPEERARRAEANRSRPVNQESIDSSKMGKFGKMFGSVLDSIRAIPHEGAKHLADAYQRALDYRQELTGRYTNPAVEAGNKLTAQDKVAVQKAIEQYHLTGKVPEGLSQAAKTFINTGKTLLDKLGKEHIANNIPINEGGRLRQMKQYLNYWPTMASQKVEEVFRQGTDFVAMKRLQKEFEDWQQKMGKSPKDARAAFDNWKASISGSMSRSGLSHQDYFNALRKSQGTPLPPSFREQDPVKNLARYFDRAGLAMAHYAKVEANPKAMAALGQKKDAWGKEIPQYKEGGIAGNKYIQAGVNQFHSIPKGAAEHTEEGLSSLSTALFISSPGLEVHKVGSNVIKSTLYAPNPYIAVRAITHAIVNIRQGWVHAKEGGLVKMSAVATRDMLDASLNSHQRMAGIAKLVRDISSLGGMTTKANAAYQQAYFENLIPSLMHRAATGDKTSAMMLKHWDPDYTIGKMYDKSGVQRLASTAASYVHGTGDIRQMPAWMMQEGEISGFMQLAHWSVAQTNNFMHDVWMPAKGGNYVPLITGIFGSAVGGYMIKELREKLQGKKGQIPSLAEIGASEGGFAGNKGLVMYNAIAGMQYAGFGGLFSQIAKYPFDAAYKNNPQGATFPLDELATDIGETVHQVSTAIANDPNLNWVDMAAAVSQHLLGSNIKLASIAINQGINHGLIVGMPAEKKQLADKMGELRRFDMVTGLPYGEVDAAANPYMNLEQKKFKMEQDPQKEATMLPRLVKNIMDTYHANPDVMMSKLEALKQSSYDTFPSMEKMPLSFMKYVGYLGREEGPAKAQEALHDYLMHKTVNEIKSSIVP